VRSKLHLRLRQLQVKATGIVNVIEGKQKPLVGQKQYWEALSAAA
jgi:hypothetical protein